MGSEMIGLGCWGGNDRAGLLRGKNWAGVRGGKKLGCAC